MLKEDRPDTVCFAALWSHQCGRMAISEPYCVGMRAGHAIQAAFWLLGIGADAAAVFVLRRVTSSRVFLLVGIWTSSPIVAVRFGAQDDLQRDC